MRKRGQKTWKTGKRQEDIEEENSERKVWKESNKGKRVEEKRERDIERKVEEWEKGKTNDKKVKERGKE